MCIFSQAGAGEQECYDLGWNAIVEYDDADVDWAVETRAGRARDVDYFVIGFNRVAVE